MFNQQQLAVAEELKQSSLNQLTTSMKLWNSENVDELEEMGWRRGDAKVYCTMLRRSEWTVQTLKSEMEMGRSATHDKLDNLHDDGRVKLVAEDPKKYKPVPPEDLMQNEVGDFKSRAEGLKTNLSEIAERGILTDPKADLSIIQNLSGMNNEILECLQNTEKQVMAFDVRKDFVSGEIIRIMREKSDDIDVKVVARETQDKKLKRLENSGIDVATYTAVQKSSFYVFDDNKVILDIEDGNKAVAFENKYFADILRKEFQNLTSETSEVETVET